jgi:prepilin-type processing-associated H-X9-DG protein
MLREQDDTTLFAVTTADRFIVVRGPDREHTRELLASLLGREGGRLAGDATFRAGRVQSTLTHEDLYAYVDLSRLLAAFLPEMPETFRRGLEVSGVLGLQAATLAVSIEPPGVRDELCLLAPAPRRGLFALADPATLDESTWLRYVPVDAVSFSAGRMDLGTTYRLLWELGELLVGRSATRLHQQLAEFEGQVGVSVGEDILDQVGPEMVEFTVLPRLGPVGGRSDTLIVLAVRDRERLQSALDKLKTYFQSHGGTPPETPSSLLLGPGETPLETPEGLFPGPGEASPPQPIQVQWEERTFDGHPLTRVLIANPWQPVEPSFTFYRDESVTPPRDLLLLAFRFQSLKNMLSYVAGSDPGGALNKPLRPSGASARPGRAERPGPGSLFGSPLPTARTPLASYDALVGLPDIRTNPDFSQLRPALPATVADLSYSDLRRQFLATYWLAVAFASLAQGQSGQTLFNPDLIPPPQDVAQHLFGLVTATTSDEATIRYQAYGPVAYSTLVAGGAAALGFAVPASIRQHQLASRKECQAHLERLGVELSLYASAHDGRSPQSLKELTGLRPAQPALSQPKGDAQAVPALSTGEATLPDDSTELAEVWLRCPGQPLATGIGYEYVPGATKDSPPQTIVAYDRKGNHPGGRNVLFVDGRVVWLKEDVFQSSTLRLRPEGQTLKH